jgi:hypothetical protein
MTVCVLNALNSIPHFWQKCVDPFQMKSPFQHVVLTSNPFGIQKGVKRPSGICFVEQRKRYKVKPLGNSGFFAYYGGMMKIAAVVGHFMHICNDIANMSRQVP